MTNRTLLASGCIALATALLLGAAPQDRRGTTTTMTTSVLVVEGETVPIRSVSGGAIYCDVVTEKSQQPGVSEKRPGPPRFEEITVDVAELTPRVRNMITKMFSGAPEPVSGNVYAADQYGKAVSDLQITDAHLTEVTIPACDAAQTTPAFFQIKLAPRELRHAGAGGNVPGGGSLSAKQRNLTGNAFRLEIPGLDCSRISRIEPITIRLPVTGGSTGESRDYERTPGGAIELPVLRVTFAAESRQSWEQWFDQFVMKGQDDEVPQAELTFLAADLKAPLATFRFHNLGIVRLAPAPTPAGSSQPPRLVADLYFERIELVK